jgi:hypothetical protein
MTRWWVFVVFVAACGEPKDGRGVRSTPDAAADADPGVDVATVDAVPALDAAVAADGPMVTCTAAPTYPSAPADETAGAGPGEVYWLGRLDPTSMPDLLQLTLYEGYGVFAGGITPATVQIAGDELGFATCGACFFLFTDLHMVGADLEITDYYMPTSGTVDITSVTGRFQATITNLTLQHMVISGNDLVPANDGCEVTIPSLTMDALIE